MARKRSLLNWRAKLALLLVAFVLVGVGASTWLGLQTREEVFRRTTLEGLSALAKAKADTIEQFTEDRMRYVERLAPLIAPALARLQLAKTEAAAEREQPAEQEAPLPKLEDAEELSEIVQDSAEVPPSEVPPSEVGPSETPTPDEAESTEPTVDETASETQAEDHPSVEEARINLRRKLGLISWDHESFEELLVLDTTGRVVASTFKGHEATTAESLDYFKKGLKTTFLQPVFRSPITETLTMVIATPIHDEEHDLIGVLVARLNLKRFFQRIGDTTGLGETGETVVAKKRDDEVVFMAPTRHDPEAALQRRMRSGDEEEGIFEKAATGHHGVGEGIDYRNVPVFAAWRPVDSIDWGLVVKIDRDEAMRTVEESKRTTAALAGVIVALAMAASLLVARAFVAPLRQLQAATERISRGDFDVSVDIHSRDEIGDLADSFERMVAAIKFFREHARHDDEDEDEDLAEVAPLPPPGNEQE